MLNRIQTRAIWRTTVPGTETVTLYVRSSSSAPSESNAAYTAYTIGHAKKRPSSTSEESHGAVYQVGLRHRNWQIFQDALDAVSAPAPKTGDYITDSDGTKWLIGSVSRRLFDNFYDCECSERPSNPSMP